jgi:TolA-binding protein
MRPHEPLDPGLSGRAADAVEVIRRHFGDLPDVRREALLHTVQSRMNVRPPRRRLSWSVGVAGAAAACAALVGGALAVHRHGRPQALSFRVEGADLRSGGYVEATSSSRPVLRFSDGSEVALTEGARAHVRAVDERGARFTLDEGQAHAYVVHSPATRWSFDAGPYVVIVTGTSFGISWISAEGRLDVRLENGAVMVSGPVFDTPVALRAGQSLTVHGHEVVIRDLSSAEPASSKERDAPVGLAAPGPDLQSESNSTGERLAGGSPAPRRAARPSPRGSAPTSNYHWAAKVVDGKFDAVVDEALQIGLDSVLAASSSDDLSALADAARYTRRNDVARAAFLAMRRRFESSERARVAAFSLGRLAESLKDVRVALSWFETYLMEAPEGTYASEALGRKMLLVQQLDGPEAARPLAEAYQRRFPSGTYAQAARALTLGP